MFYNFNAHLISFNETVSSEIVEQIIEIFLITSDSIERAGEKNAKCFYK